MATCALSNTEIMTHYYVRVKGRSESASFKNNKEHLFLSLDCDPGDVAAYLSEHLKYDEEYRFLWSPINAEMDQVDGMVSSKADIDAIVAHYPFGGAVPRPYLTTEEYAAQQAGRGVVVPPKPISKQGLKPFGG